jgi:hypothetical protein
MSNAVDLLPDGLELAPVWRRAVAVLINLLVVAAGLVAAGAAVFGAIKLGLCRRLTAARRLLAGRLAAWRERFDPANRPMGLSARTRLLVSGASLALELDGRNRRGIGARVMGIRRVDVRTGGPITLRVALIRHVVSHGCGVATGWILGPITKRSISRMEEIQPALPESQRVHADDPEALQEATSKLYRDLNVNPSASCLWPPMLAVVFVRMLPVFLSPLRQSLPDRVAGIVAVLDHSTPDQHHVGGGL